MECQKFLKSGGGRGRPGFDSICASCQVRWADHPKTKEINKKPSVPRLKTLMKIKAGRKEELVSEKAVSNLPTSLEVETHLQDQDQDQEDQEDQEDEEVSIEEINIEADELPARKQPLPEKGALPVAEAPVEPAITPPAQPKNTDISHILSMFQDQASTDDW